MLTLGRCEKHILLTTGLASMPAGLSTLEAANEAGHLLALSGPWAFWKRHTTLNVTGGQNYITLPADFLEMIGLQYASGTLSWLGSTDYGFVQDLRGGGSGTSDRPSMWAVEPNTATDGTVTYRIELHSTPSGTGTVATLNVYYFGGWQEPEDGADSARIPVPEWMEGIYKLFLEAVAHGHIERDTAAVDARVNAIRASTMFLDAQRRDRAMQLNLGPIRGGGVAMQMSPTFFRHWAANAPSL